MKWTQWALAGLAVVLVGGGVYVGWQFHPDPPEPTRTVTDEVVIDKPEAAPTITERIVYHSVPVEVTRTVTEIDTVVVREFIEAAGDSLADPIHLPYAVEYDGQALLMWGTMSNGARTYNEFDVQPTFRAGWDADSAYAREERLARFPKWKVAGGAVVVGAVAVCVFVFCK